MDNLEEIKKFNCPLCVYRTNKPTDWVKHINSRKHDRNGKRKTRHCDICNHYSLTHWNYKMHMITNHSTKEERMERVNKKSLIFISIITLLKKSKIFLIMKQKYYCFECDQVFFCLQYKKTHENSTKHKNLLIANTLQRELDEKIKLNNLI